MHEANTAVTVSEYIPMGEGQLPADGIGVQIDPWTFADFHVRIVSNLEVETADRNKLIM